MAGLRGWPSATSATIISLLPVSLPYVTVSLLAPQPGPQVQGDIIGFMTCSQGQPPFLAREGSRK